MSNAETLDQLMQHFERFRSDSQSANKPFFWLGAGCSVHDGVPLNLDLITRVMGPSPGAWGSPQYRFDQFCDNLGKGDARVAVLGPHINCPITPDSPYHRLVQLLAGGFTDVVVTLNIDNLLEQALAAAGLREHHDYLLISVPELQPEAAVARIRSGQGPRIRIVKLHGGQEWGMNLMTSREIIRYDERIERLVRKISSRPAVVCGYSFFHLNVLQAFSREGGPLFYVNLSFPDAPMVLSLMAERNRSPLFVDGADGNFGNFTRLLTNRLTP